LVGGDVSGGSRMGTTEPEVFSVEGQNSIKNRDQAASHGYSLWHHLFSQS
jgi:hypothetical protein